MNDQGQPGNGWTVVLRRRPVRMVEGRPEGGYTEDYEIVCCDYHYLTSRAALAAVNAVAIDETGSVLQPASTSVETGDPTYADHASRQ